MVMNEITFAAVKLTPYTTKFNKYKQPVSYHEIYEFHKIFQVIE